MQHKFKKFSRQIPIFYVFFKIRRILVVGFHQGGSVANRATPSSLYPSHSPASPMFFPWFFPCLCRLILSLIFCPAPSPALSFAPNPVCSLAPSPCSFPSSFLSSFESSFLCYFPYYFLLLVALLLPNLLPLLPLLLSSPAPSPGDMGRFPGLCPTDGHLDGRRPKTNILYYRQ